MEMIQDVIARLADNSFFMKGWGLTVTGAIYAFAASNLNWRVSALGLLPAMAFWLLDSYFLRQERLYGHLYNDARRFDGSVELFTMDTRAYVGREKWGRVALSTTLAPFYVVILTAGVLLTVIAAWA